MSGQGHGSRGDFPTRVSLLGLAETAHGKGLLVGELPAGI